MPPMMIYPVTFKECDWGGWRQCRRQAEWVIVWGCPQCETIGERYLCDGHSILWRRKSTTCTCGTSVLYTAKYRPEMFSPEQI